MICSLFFFIPFFPFFVFCFVSLKLPELDESIRHHFGSHLCFSSAMENLRKLPIRLSCNKQRWPTRVKTTENKLKAINISAGTSSKMFWNLIRQIKKNNSEDLYIIKIQNGEKLFNGKYIKQYTELCYKEMYSKKTSSTYRKS